VGVSEEELAGMGTQAAQRILAEWGSPPGGAEAGTVILGMEWPVLSPWQW
jgi:hypothetical protein